MLKPDTPIGDFIPLSTHVAPHVLKTREGDYLVTWYLEGLPFVGRDDWSLTHKHNTFNKLLQSLRAPDYVNLSFWVHDVRRRRKIQIESHFAESFNQKLNDEYFAGLAQQGVMQNELYLTMIYRPVVVGKKFMAKSSDYSVLTQEQEQAIHKLMELAGHVEETLRDYTPYLLGMYEGDNGLIFSENLEFYSYLLNRVDEPVPVLKAPVYDYLASSRHFFSNKAGDFVVRTSNGVDHYGAILNIKEYVEGTWPGVLNGMKYLDFEYVMTHSFSPMGRQDALKVLDRTKGMMISSGDKAVSQVLELDQAMDQLASGNFVLGEYHFTLAVYADNQDMLYQRIAQARAELSNAGFIAVKEDLAIASSYYSQIPANWKYRTRLANLSSLNFLGLSPLHNFTAGKRDGNPWGECVTALQTVSGQPYYFNFHATDLNQSAVGEKALGNTMVIGKSGTGKTVLINFLLSQTQKYEDKPTIFFFDKDRGAEIFVRACRGNYMAIEQGKPSGFNPFACQATEQNVQFLVGFVKLLVGHSKYSAREDDDILRAVCGVLDAPLELRNLSNLQKSLPNLGDDSIFAHLKKWTKSGSLGWLFDNAQDLIDLNQAKIIGFDYTELLDNPEIRTPVITYLIHRFEALLDGRPIIFVMDEFWKILEGDHGLKDFAQNKQKTIRKQNGLGIFVTQSPEDALKSDIAATLIEQTATMILLPNPRADKSDYVDGLKLTESEFELVASLDERSRCFLVKQGNQSALCQLSLDGMDEVLAVISSTTDNVELMQRLVDERGAEPELWMEAFYQQRKGFEPNTQMQGSQGLARKVR